MKPMLRPGKWTLKIIDGRATIRNEGEIGSIEPIQYTLLLEDSLFKLGDARLFAGARNLLDACEMALNAFRYMMRNANAFEKNNALDWVLLESAIADVKGEHDESL